MFDVDGVLLDSLPQHLRFCEDMALELGLDLRVPDVEGFRELARGGDPVAPMEALLRTVGFPRVAATRADDVYQRTFADGYAVCAFPGIRLVTNLLRENGYTLGIVTSNTWGNVAAALGDLLSSFQKSCILTRDDGLSKAEGLLACATRMGLRRKEDLLYVGDQSRDRLAAEGAGVSFLGVTYGWEINSADHCATVDCPLDVASWVLGTERAKPRAYLTAPEAFLGIGPAKVARAMDICAGLGFEGVLPADEGSRGNSGHSSDLALAIGRRNRDRIRTCDLLVADLTQAQSSQGGLAAVEEVGFAVGLGIPVWVCSAEPRGLALREADHPGAEGVGRRVGETVRSGTGAAVWEFNLCCPGGRLILHGEPAKSGDEDFSGLEQCLRVARGAFHFERA